jgi:molybdopterin-guanine dinucleotide biosynthesis protein A
MALDLLRGSTERGNALRAGVILIGGKSTRMGTDKSALVLGGQTLLDRTITALSSLVGEILIVGKASATPAPVAENQSSGSVLGLKPGVDLGALLGGGTVVANGITAASDVYGSGVNKGVERTVSSALPPIRRVPDRWPGEGPLGGILSAFASTAAMELLVVAVDLPWLSATSLRELCEAPMQLRAKRFANETTDLKKSNAGKSSNRRGEAPTGDADCLMTMHQGRLQPLHARYSRRCQTLLEPQFTAGERSILRCKLAVGEHVAPDHDRSSQDVDTPAQWELAQEDF